MSPKFTSSLSMALLLFHAAIAACEENGSFDHPIVPKDVIPLFNGRNLDGWYTWLQDTGYKDPRHVFTVDDEGYLHVSGDGFGGVVTRKYYANYHLILEYRWGGKTWPPREKAARDGGLLLNCYGPDGAFGRRGDKPGPWMTSVECQIIEGGVGDMLILQGVDADGKKLNSTVTATVTNDRDGEPCWDPAGEKRTFTSGRINWYGRDPDWKDVIGYRGTEDVDSPGEEWTRLECYCDQDTLTYVVNGIVVNHASNVFPDRGKIFFQTEGAEIIVRKLELRPLPSDRPWKK